MLQEKRHICGSKEGLRTLQLRNWNTGLFYQLSTSNDHKLKSNLLNTIENRRLYTTILYNRETACVAFGKRQENEVPRPNNCHQPLQSERLTFLSVILKELFTKFSNFCSVFGSGFPLMKRAHLIISLSASQAFN